MKRFTTHTIRCKQRRRRAGKTREKKRGEKTQKEAPSCGTPKLCLASSLAGADSKSSNEQKVHELGSDLKKMNRIFNLSPAKIIVCRNKTNDTLRGKKNSETRIPTTCNSQYLQQTYGYLIKKINIRHKLLISGVKERASPKRLQKKQG